MPDLHMSHEKMSDLVSLPLLEFTLVIKLRNSNFEHHLILFLQKKKKSQI